MASKLLNEIKEEIELFEEFFYHKPHKHHHRRILKFNIHQIKRGHHMALLSIAPGNSPVFQATPVPAGLTPTTPPTWASSDETNAPVTADATGLIGTVAIPTTAVVGTSFTLTVSYTNPDGQVATGSATFVIVAPATPDITSFDIAQVA